MKWMGRRQRARTGSGTQMLRTHPWAMASTVVSMHPWASVAAFGPRLRPLATWARATSRLSWSAARLCSASATCSRGAFASKRRGGRGAWSAPAACRTRTCSTSSRAAPRRRRAGCVVGLWCASAGCLRVPCVRVGAPRGYIEPSCTDAALGSYVASSGGRKAESQGVSSSCLSVCAISEGEGEGEAQAQAEGQGEGQREGRALRWPEQRVARCVSKGRADLGCIQRVTRLRVQRPRKKGMAVRLSMPVRIIDTT